MRAQDRQAQAPINPSNVVGPPGPIGRSGLIRLLKRFPQRLVWAGFVLTMGFVSIAILATVAMVSRTPFIFPSLGPTAILFFFHPMSPSASPRHALYGHAIGIFAVTARYCCWACNAQVRK